MERRRIGNLEVSVVGLGGNAFGTDFFGRRCDQDEVTRIVATALDSGVNLIDTAEEYSISSHIGEGHSEELIGIAVRGRRDEAVLATKFLNTTEDDPAERGADRIVAAVEASLRRLGTDRIDLYQQHQPDPDIPIDEILTALDRLVRDGKVLEIGCCNFDAHMLDAAAERAAALGAGSFQSCQVQYSILERPPAELLAATERHQTPILAYFPLASGLLTGKYRKGEPPPPDSRLGADAAVSEMLRGGILATRPPLSEERLDTVAHLAAFAADHGRTLIELAISWLTNQASVGSVIAGVTKAHQVTANASAAGWRLTPDDLTNVDAIVAAEGTAT